MTEKNSHQRRCMLEHDKKSHRQTLTIELDQKTDEYDHNNKNKLNSLRLRTCNGR